MNLINDTICALATGSGGGAISVIRISGKDSLEIADKVFSGKTKIAESKSHTIHYGRIVSESITIDDVLVSVFCEPHSYTGENSVEISSHASMLIVQKITSALIDAGARLALPGEFTKRAFLNGRMDLSQAEAVADIISSSTEISLRGARNQFDGRLSDKINELRNSLIQSSSLVELELDFAEEDVEFLSREQLINNINGIVEEINRLLNSYQYGKVIREGVNLVIAGQPNVGKSSLLNYILKESRAIVSDTPGTTRDVIREYFQYGGILFNVYDTAGIRDSGDIIEQEGVSRSRKSILAADIVIYLYDSQTGFSNELYNELSALKGKEKIITVQNKIDIPALDTLDSEVRISAITGEGVELLLSSIIGRVFVNGIYTEHSIIVTNLRHYKALEKARCFLIDAIKTSEEHLSGEYISVDIHNALDSLSEIIGVVNSDDILNNIFAKFCIGK